MDRSSYGLVKRLLKSYIGPHRVRLTWSIICMLVVAGATSAITFMVKPMLDEVFINRNADMLYTIPAIIVGLFIIKGIASYFQAFYMEYIGQSLVADLQLDLFRRSIHQDLTFFQKYTTTGLTSRFLYDLHRLKQAVSQTITGSLRDLATVFGLIGVMFYHDWFLAIMSITVLPLAVYPIIRFGKNIRRYSMGSQEEMGTLSRILKEGFGYNRQVKTYAMEAYEINRAQKSIGTVFKLLIKSARIRAISSPSMELLGGISIAFIIFYGGQQVMHGETTAGTFFSFLTALMLLYRPIKGIANINNVLQEGLAAAERTFELLDTTTKVKELPNAAPLNITVGKINFTDVTFTYEGENGSIINNLSLEIPAGKVVAIVGASGAGKSTILNLIPRFFDASHGKVTIDDTDIKTVSLKSLRKNISLVTQDVAVFDETIHNNIAYGTPNATREQVEEAAKSAAAHGFISELPKGYNTPVGEEGFRLSGGQKQRLAIARAMLKNAPILLLDEATSSLDSESEQKVQTALNHLMKGRTTLIVAHRLSTVIHADCIYVIDKGTIIESGTHVALIARNGAYAHLYNLQSVA